MKQRPLTTAFLAGANLSRRPLRTACLVTVVTVLAFAIFGGSVLSVSLGNGFRSLKERMGADLAVVPLEHESDYEGIILTGEPERFYLDKSLVDQLAGIEGVKQVTAQFYLSSLSAKCCSVPVQLIGIDPDTDFVTQPWITKVYHQELADGDLIVGSEVQVDDSGKLKFFNSEYRVAARLDKTSTGMDSSVFANMNTIKLLLAGARSVGMNLSADVYDVDADHDVSAILIRVQDGYDAKTVVTNIRRGISGISVVESQSIFSGVADQLTVIFHMVQAVTILFWVFAAVLLAVVSTASLNERRREFALLRFLGASRRKLSGIVLAEALCVGALGGVLGSALAALAVFPFSTYIGDRLGMPYFPPAAGTVCLLLGLSILIPAATGPLAALYAAIRAARKEPCAALREGE